VLGLPAWGEYGTQIRTLFVGSVESSARAARAELSRFKNDAGKAEKDEDAGV